MLTMPWIVIIPFVLVVPIQSMIIATPACPRASVCPILLPVECILMEPELTIVRVAGRIQEPLFMLPLAFGMLFCLRSEWIRKLTTVVSLILTLLGRAQFLVVKGAMMTSGTAPAVGISS